MNQPKEVNWTEILRPAASTIRPDKSRKCTCGGKNCQTAKKIKCVCRCHSENHGAANRQGMEPLDKTLGLEKEALVPLGDLGLNLELSGRSELEGMI